MGTLTLGGILVDIIIISSIITSTFLGYRKGLIDVIYKLFAFIVAIILALALYKPVSTAIINNTQFDEKIASSIESKLANTTIETDGVLSTENTNLSEGVVNIINSLISKAASNAQNSDKVPYISLELARMIVRLVSIIIVYILAHIILLVVRFAAEILANLPIIDRFNKSGGFIYGLLKGILVVYIILTIFSLISPLISSWGIINAINKSLIGGKMYNNNIIINLVSK